MKILFTLIPPNGSYGGGAFFVKNMINELINKGHNIVTGLEQGIDIIFIIDPRKDIHNRFGVDDIIQYKKANPNVKIIHRINENDIKRKNSIGIEKLILKTMVIADHIVFVSRWLYNHYHNYDLVGKYNIKASMSVIHSGIDTLIYHPEQNNLIEKNVDKIRIITHHWSNNYLKGFEIYHYLDKYISEHPDCNIEFTYIGNYNFEGYRPRATKIYPPMSSKEIANHMRKNNIYLTATQWEPGAMHYLEAMGCGLPILYRTNGGGTHEVCKECGIEFDKKEEIIDKIYQIIENREKYINNIDYEYISKERCVEDFMKIIN